jgi:hypothetical protein
MPLELEVENRFCGSDRGGVTLTLAQPQLLVGEPDAVLGLKLRTTEKPVVPIHLRVHLR